MLKVIIIVESIACGLYGEGQNALVVVDWLVIQKDLQFPEHSISPSSEPRLRVCCLVLSTQITLTYTLLTRSLLLPLLLGKDQISNLLAIVTFL